MRERIGENSVQFRDLKTQYQRLKPNIDAAIQSVLHQADFILGEPVTELENTLAAYVGRKYCVSCANGTDALQLALTAMHVGAGDAVFVPNFTYIASAGAASLCGAAVIPVDVDARTFNISPQALESAVLHVLSEKRRKPKVILAVDLFGLPADYDALVPIAEKYGMEILEDGAQGFGGSIRGKRACSFGKISTTSFFPAKPLGCYGDGGAIFTDDDAVNTRLRSLRAQGRSETDKYDHLEVGVNSRLDTLQAAILLPKFQAFTEYELSAVNQAAQRYTERLKDAVVTPYIPNGYTSAWAQYTIMLRDSETRGAVQTALKAQGIPSMIYYPRGIHQQKAYAYLQVTDAWYPNTLHAAETVLSLPIHPYLEQAQADKISEVIKSCL